MEQLESIINAAFEQRADLTPASPATAERAAVAETLARL